MSDIRNISNCVYSKVKQNEGHNNSSRKRKMWRMRVAFVPNMTHLLLSLRCTSVYMHPIELDEKCWQRLSNRFEWMCVFRFKSNNFKISSLCFCSLFFCLLSDSYQMAFTNTLFYIRCIDKLRIGYPFVDVLFFIKT